MKSEPSVLQHYQDRTTNFGSLHQLGEPAMVHPWMVEQAAHCMGEFFGEQSHSGGSNRQRPAIPPSRFAPDQLGDCQKC